MPIQVLVKIGTERWMSRFRGRRNLPIVRPHDAVCSHTGLIWVKPILYEQNKFKLHENVQMGPVCTKLTYSSPTEVICYANTFKRVASFGGLIDYPLIW